MLVVASSFFECLQTKLIPEIFFKNPSNISPFSAPNQYKPSIYHLNYRKTHLTVWGDDRLRASFSYHSFSSSLRLCRPVEFIFLATFTQLPQYISFSYTSSTEREVIVTNHVSCSRKFSFKACSMIFQLVS